MEIVESKKIKRLREQTFTEKRNPYKKYQKAKWNWTDIFNEIDEMKSLKISKFIKKVSNKYGIKYQTLLNKYYIYKNKNDKILNINDENRGGYNKVFKEHEEYEIYLFLKNNFIDENQMLCNDIIKFYAQDEYQKIYKNNNFHASDGWCNMFKQRWNLSTVKCSISKIATKIYTDIEIDDFLKKCSDGYIKVGSFFF